MESDDLAQKIYFYNLVEQRGGKFPKPFFGEMNSLKIKHFKKIHFFLVFEYGNLTGVKTYRDRLRNSGKVFMIESSNSPILERIEGPMEALDAS